MKPRADLENCTLSVLVLTYNHASYVDQTLQSIAAQSVDVPWEVLIADDASTDATRAVVEASARRLGIDVRFIYQAANVGANRNVVAGIAAARGTYLAFVEGDDYWTDSKKLAKQLSFLTTHPDFSLCAHWTQTIEQTTGGELPTIYADNHGRQELANSLRFRPWFHASSIMVRTKYWRELPPWFYNHVVADRILSYLPLKHGPAMVLPEFMSVYRVHGTSLWTPLDPKTKTDHLQSFYRAVALDDAAMLPYALEGEFRARMAGVKALLRMRRVNEAWRYLYASMIEPRYGQLAASEKMRILAEESVHSILYWTTRFKDRLARKLCAADKS